MPLVAFDRKATRLGYGKGYYDRRLRAFGQHTGRSRPLVSGSRRRRWKPFRSKAGDQTLDCNRYRERCGDTGCGGLSSCLRPLAMRLAQCLVPSLASPLRHALKPLCVSCFWAILSASRRQAVTEQLPALRARWKLDCVVINGENAAGGFGITEAIVMKSSQRVPMW